MAKSMRGTFETVPFRSNESVLLYLNNEYTDYDIHWHTAAEIIVPLENGYQVTIGRQVFRMKEHDILFLPPGALHSLQAPPTGRRMILMFNFSPLGSLRDFSPLLPVLSQPLLITPEEPEEAASFSEKGLLPARQSLSGESPAHQNPAERGNSVSPTTELHREAFRLMQQICDIYPDHSEPLRIPMIYSCLIQFFVLVGRHHVRRDLLSPDTKSRRQTDCYERLNASLNFINSNYMNDISVEDAARTAGFSKFHFSRLFKQFTEQTFCEYLNQRRINAAETLLLNQRLSVTDVALQSGFSSLSTFNRTFRALKSCTPSEFKAFHQRRGIRLRKQPSENEAVAAQAPASPAAAASTGSAGAEKDSAAVGLRATL